MEDGELFRLAVAGYSGLDHITGLTNLRQFLREVQRELARTRRNGGNLGVVVLEPIRPVDISVVAGHLQGIVREEDLIARLGEAMIASFLCLFADTFCIIVFVLPNSLRRMSDD